jgi:hypothetical protein
MNYYNLISMMPKAPAYDADAQAFITATGISGTNASAINTLVLDLKAASIWTKMKAIYPIVGGTGTSHKFNLKNPLDTDAAFRLVFNGGWTHSANGILPNGTNAYANTFFVPSSHLTLHNTHMGYYSRTSGMPGSTTALMGANSNTSIYNGLETFVIYRATTSIQITQNAELLISDIGFSTQTNSQGFWVNSRTSPTATTLKLFKNGVSLNNATTSPAGQALNTNSLYIGAIRNMTIAVPHANLYSNCECAFASIGVGLSDAEALSFYNAVQTFQTTLGRQV